MPRIQSSRRIAPLRDVEYDHEIVLVDEEANIVVTPPPADRESERAAEDASPSQPSETHSTVNLIQQNTSENTSKSLPSTRTSKASFGADTRPSISSALLSVAGAGAATGGGASLPVPSKGSSHAQYVMSVPNESGMSVLAGARTEIRGVSRPSMEGTTGENSMGLAPEATICSNTACKKATQKHEWVIDVLYENQRGLFLCSTPLFSAKALGNLDPSPWTNTYHKPSLTCPQDTQLPDPSWEWVWPEWRVNHDPLTACDDDGWEYSFMFSDKFSWHGPTWYSSFVRRRAWTRKRCRIQPGTSGLVVNNPTVSYDPMTYPNDVESRDSDSPNRVGRSQSQSHTHAHRRRHSHSHTHDTSHSRSQSAVRRRSMAETTRATRAELGLEDGLTSVEIYDTQLLLHIIRAQRIDREKLEAMENYLCHARDDLQHLQDVMHEIMKLFVFQNSRRQVLAQVALACEQTEARLNGMADGAEECVERQAVRKRLGFLQAARKHAEEEVRRLAYWSDVRVLGDRLGDVEAAEDKEEC
ncbi:hypothetical protein TD95_002727 [Thielaviopsis punctulata]|uniref:Peroxin/Ferlin domain-containing protein n=1 Tax=Thielaviopsis punctulata TaxID=72032 RepID=A0A0F4ZM72_9PEZI|nr:hypothetical protein TD95_002727 [Thielaviopsis punctulata]